MKDADTHSPPPPRLAAWLLERCLSPAHDGVIGDLEEEYHDRTRYDSPGRAALVFWMQTLHAILQSLANRVELSAWIFAAGILPVLLLALLTISSQTIKAGLTNPVDTLRNE